MRTSVWVAVLCSSTERVLIAKRGRPVRNAGLWNFFGGGLDEGEHPQSAAARELWEEGGIHVAETALSYLGEATSELKRNVLFGVAMDWEVVPQLNVESEAWRWISLADLSLHQRLHPATERLMPFAHSFAVAASSRRRSLSSRAWGGDVLDRVWPPQMPGFSMPNVGE